MSKETILNDLELTGGKRRVYEPSIANSKGLMALTHTFNGFLYRVNGSAPCLNMDIG